MPSETEIISLWDDCTRMTREFYPVISVSCLQLHRHVIPFLPVDCRLSQVYGPKLQSDVDVKQGRVQAWSPCVRVLEGHSGPCYCLAFSPDGERLVSGADDHTVRLWNVQTGALLHVMAGHSSPVVSITYSPDGMLIASASLDHTVRIWDAAAGLEVGVYAEHSAAVYSVAFSPDNQRIASGDDQGKVHVWSTDAGLHRSEKILEVFDRVTWLEFVGPNRVIVASKCGSVTVWELESASCVERHDDFGEFLAFVMAPDKKVAASMNEARDVTI